jgi:hypothetical protein
LSLWLQQPLVGPIPWAAVFFTAPHIIIFTSVRSSVVPENPSRKVLMGRIPAAGQHTAEQILRSQYATNPFIAYLENAAGSI